MEINAPLLPELDPHPDSPAHPVGGLRVEVKVRPDSALELVYRLAGDVGRLRIPAPAPPVRIDGLWKHTCCEAFIAGSDAPAYREFNFSPSGQWQAYRFRAYRDGGPSDAVSPPTVRCEARQGGLTLTAVVPAAGLPPGTRLRLGLCAVVEAADGSLSYWALWHPPGRPDFHQPDTFALDLDLGEITS